ncbi:hypothetical protein QUF73_20825 [Cytobacillus sp. NJ13]|nr:hypothetical protein [Cytobacillus sp. NJ13]
MDRKGRKRPGVVRTRGKFGQESEKKAGVCPNPGQVRTGKAEKGLELSEPGASSDRKARKRPEYVRIKGKFGQERQENAQGLSESEANSDRKARKRPGAVQTRGKFGQERQKKARVCPNPGQV